MFGLANDPLDLLASLAMDRIEDYSDWQLRWFWPGDLTSLKEETSCNSAPWNANEIADILAKRPDVTWEAEQEERCEPESEI